MARVSGRGEALTDGFGGRARVEEGTSGAAERTPFREGMRDAALAGRRCFGVVGPGELVLQGGT